MPDTTGWIGASPDHLSIRPMPARKQPDVDYSAKSNMAHVARGLARAFLHAPGSAGELQQRGIAALGRTWPWLAGLVRKLGASFKLPLRPQDFEQIVVQILLYRPFFSAFHLRETKPRIYRYFSFKPQMSAPPTALGDIALPSLHTLGDLAQWLGLSAEELDWFADTDGWGSRSPIEALRHYRYMWKAKASGGYRLIEIPKERLGLIQRQILREILDKIPPHPAAHGCVRGRSIRSNAEQHVGAPILLKLDLADFFTSISAARVHALFSHLGYPNEVARKLMALTTHTSHPGALATMPQADSASHTERLSRRNWSRKFQARHLPQGAASSPALANLCAYRLDLRLAAAAQECGARYTRYVDDLVFSCETNSFAHARRMALMFDTIIREEGFTPNPHKTRIMTRAQAQYVTGVVVNAKTNVPRAEFEQLKAILCNCVCHGPSSQNRAAHPDFRAYLLGRIAHVRHLNPARGGRLQSLFGQIQWPLAQA